MLLLADEKTGTMALCSHELHGSDDLVNRLLVNIQPRMLLVPSITPSKPQSAIASEDEEEEKETRQE